MNAALKIVHIETELGNQIIEALLKAGWKKAKAYHVLAFDKGIDFDSYTLKQDGSQLHFEWTNWFEWEVTGSRHAVEALIKTYDLSEACTSTDNDQ